MDIDASGAGVGRVLKEDARAESSEATQKFTP
jgi:hypothetical protein